MILPYNKNVAMKEQKQAQLDRAKELFQGPWPQWADPDDIDRARARLIKREEAPPDRATVFMLELRLPNQYTKKTSVLWYRFNYLVLPQLNTSTNIFD